MAFKVQLPHARFCRKKVEFKKCEQFRRLVHALIQCPFCKRAISHGKSVLPGNCARRDDSSSRARGLFVRRQPAHSHKPPEGRRHAADDVLAKPVGNRSAQKEPDSGYAGPLTATARHSNSSKLPAIAAPTSKPPWCSAKKPNSFFQSERHNRPAIPRQESKQTTHPDPHRSCSAGHAPVARHDPVPPRTGGGSQGRG